MPSVQPQDKVVTGNTEFTRPENRAFYPALDGLRAIAFLMVFFQHYCGMPWGWTGVDVFFVLSGFLITGILYDTRNDTHRLRNFYVRRTLRIFPLYYGLFLILLLTTPLFRWDWSWPWLIWPAYLGNYARYLHPFLGPNDPMRAIADAHLVGVIGHHPGSLAMGHFWSLCIEEQFYLLWPWVVFWIRDRVKLVWICAASIPICLGLRILGHHILPTWMIQLEVFHRATPFRIDSLLWGGLLALILRGPNAQRLLRAARIALPVLLAAFVIWAIVSPYGRIWKPYPDWTGVWEWGLTVIDIVAVVLLLLAIQPGHFIYRFLHLRPLRWLGRMSYGAYIFHAMLITTYAAAARAVMPSHPVFAMTIIALSATMLISWLSYRFFESPFLNLKERWTIR